VYLSRQALGEPFPPLKFESEGSQAISPAAAMIGSAPLSATPEFRDGELESMIGPDRDQIKPTNNNNVQHANRGGRRLLADRIADLFK
jgi:hypothetical protein